MARIIRDAVSNAVMNLNDPRITSFVSVVRVQVSADMRIADISFSLFGGSEADQKKTFIAIEHAHPRIQSQLASGLDCRFCPVLRFHRDEKMKQTMEAFGKIDAERRSKEQHEQEQQEQ
jgi:ribosome-binding factor A